MALTKVRGSGLDGATALKGQELVIDADGDTSIDASSADDTIIIDTAGSERARIDSSGNFFVSATATSGFQSSSSESGSIIYGAGGIASNSASNDVPAVFNRLGNDGSIIQLKKDGSTVGNIETSGGNLIVQGSTATGKTGIKFGGAEFIPQDNGNSDNGVDLGMSSARFKDLYLGGGIYVGGTGSANHLTDFEEGTFDPFSGRGSQFTGETTRTARYRKIGTMVAIDVRVKFTGTDATSTFQLTLPFTSASASGDATSYTGSCFYEGTQLFSGASLHPHVASSSAHLVLHRGDGGTFQSVTRSNVNGTYDFLISFVYFSA